MPEPDQNRSTERSPKTRLAWGLLALLVLVGVLALPVVGGWWAVRQLEARAIAFGDIEAQWRDGPLISLSQVRIGEPATITIPRISARLSLRSLLEGRIASLEVSGLEIDLSDPGGSKSGDPTEKARGIGPQLGIPALPNILPFDHLDIDAPEFVLRTPAIKLEGNLHLEVEPDGTGRYRFAPATPIPTSTPAEFLIHFDSAEGTFALLGGSQSARIELSPIAVSPKEGGDTLIQFARSEWQATLRDPGELAIAGRGGPLELPAQALVIEVLDADLAWRPGNALPLGTLTFEEMKDLADPPRFAPLSLAVAAHGTKGAIHVTLRPASDPTATLVEATLEPILSSSRVNIAMEPIDLGAQLSNPGQQLPFLEDAIIDWSGLLHVEGSLTWADRRPRFLMDVDLVDFGAQTPFGSVSCAATRFQLTGPEPLATAGPETLTVGELSFGIPLNRGRVRYELIPGDTLLLKEMTWEVAGGDVFASGKIALDDSEQSLRLQAKSIALTQLFALLGLEGLSGTGLLDGQLPLFRRQGDLEIRGGKLTAKTGGGWIRYRPGAADSPLAASGSLDLIDLEQALRNFRYSKLSMEINGSLAKTLEIRLHLDGKNPDYRGGQPYILNLNVEGRLAALFDDGNRLYNLPDRLEKDIAEAAGADLGTSRTSGQIPCPAR